MSAPINHVKALPDRAAIDTAEKALYRCGIPREIRREILLNLATDIHVWHLIDSWHEYYIINRGVSVCLLNYEMKYGGGNIIRFTARVDRVGDNNAPCTYFSSPNILSMASHDLPDLPPGDGATNHNSMKCDNPPYIIEFRGTNTTPIVWTMIRSAHGGPRWCCEVIFYNEMFDMCEPDE